MEIREIAQIIYELFVIIVAKVENILNQDCSQALSCYNIISKYLTYYRKMEKRLLLCGRKYVHKVSLHFAVLIIDVSRR